MGSTNLRLNFGTVLKEWYLFIEIINSRCRCVLLFNVNLYIKSHFLIKKKKKDAQAILSGIFLCVCFVFLCWFFLFLYL